MMRITLNEELPKKMDINAAAKHSAALIRHIFENAPKDIRPITEHIAKAPGKGVRSSLLFAAALDESNEVPRETILAAAAIELFHLATLVHDDIIDNAKTRRGIQSVHSRFGKKEAVICGDYLFCVAFSAISTIYEPYAKFIQKFASTISQVCLGELRQHSNNCNTNINFYEYLRIIHGKTAVLFYISAYGGALMAESTESDAKKIAKFGTYCGMIFQIIDDCKDYVLDDSEALKPTKSDLATGVINMPLLMAYLKEPALRKVPFDAKKLLYDVNRLNGVAGSLDIAKKYSKKARDILCTIPNKKKSAALERLLQEQLLFFDKIGAP